MRDPPKSTQKKSKKLHNSRIYTTMRFYKLCPMREYTKNNLSLLIHTLGTTHQHLIKLDQIKGHTHKSCDARCPKGG